VGDHRGSFFRESIVKSGVRAFKAGIAPSTPPFSSLNNVGDEGEAEVESADKMWRLSTPRAVG